MTRLLDPPEAIEVTADQRGRPIQMRRPGQAWSPVEATQRWVVEVDWWTANPVSRDYWRLIVRDQFLVDVFRDHATDRWYAERIWD
jgi:hypothetical protein